MLHYVWIRIRRTPVIFAAILLFTAIISMVLCGLHRGNHTALEQYNEIYYKIDVRCTVTNLSGDQSDRLDIRPGTIALFTQPGGLSDLLEDVQIKGSLEILWNNELYTLAGITSTEIEPRLWPENGCTIFWNEGADRNFFISNTMACIVPRELQKKMQNVEASADRFPLHLDAAMPHENDFNGELEILGTYEGSSDRIIYCPWNTYVSILNAMGRGETADALHATLRNNLELPLLQETAALAFAEPDPSNAGLETVGNYYLALDINDSQLSQAETNLENSMTLNRIAAALVLLLSAAAGAFIGFLMIRNQRKEIILMRTMGTPPGQIYAGFAIEQMLFVVLGAILGGSKFMWSPPLWLALFICVYYLGLSVTLLATLRKNLLTTLKEEE